jgi:hypothetical protein
MYAIALALGVLLLSGSSAFAQDQQPAPAQPAPAATDSDQVDPAKLPVSMGRIRLKLSTAANAKSALKIERVIEVVGVAPPIELWNPDPAAKALRGPSPFGAPTQKDILDLTTPQEFKAQAIDISALLRWLALKAEGKTTE